MPLCGGTEGSSEISSRTLFIFEMSSIQDRTAINIERTYQHLSCW